MDDIRWLDDEEERIWRAFLEAGSLVVQELDSSLKSNAAMTLDDYEVLVHLSGADERQMRMTELSQRLISSQSRLTQRIDRLVDRGWVRRERCPEDRRGTFAVMTPAGWDEIESAAPGHLHDVRALLIDLIEPHERRVIADVLERVATNARTVRSAAAT